MNKYYVFKEKFQGQIIDQFKKADIQVVGFYTKKPTIEELNHIQDPMTLKVKLDKKELSLFNGSTNGKDIYYVTISLKNSTALPTFSSDKFFIEETFI
ncbi:hypothetical protein [Companilactobacillus kimchiensis]|nr:hypothetical protein [Companilactobacillus kimchiensis]